MNIIITLVLLDNLNLFYNPLFSSVKEPLVVIRAALTIVSFLYIQGSTSEIDCCQEQITGKWISYLIMKQTETAKTFLLNLKECSIIDK